MLSPDHEDDSVNSESDPLADVFSSSPPRSSAGDAVLQGPSKLRAHPSDIPRLQEQHTTAGYREGLAFAKASSVQAGFDEGFGLGATLGLEAGRVLGILEGVASALSHSGSGWEEAAQEAEVRLASARDELNLKSVFAEEYWAADGTWKYPVGRPAAEETAEKEDAVIFADVARDHPLLQKWSRIAEEESRRWGVSEGTVLALRDAEPEASTEGEETVTPRRVQGRAREPLDW